MRVIIERLERLNLSVNGNPRYRVYYSPAPDPMGNDEPWQDAITSSDHAFCYEIGNEFMRVGDPVWLTFTCAGRISGMRPLSGVASA